jgi:hypothetical protein
LSKAENGSGTEFLDRLTDTAGGALATDRQTHGLDREIAHLQSA